MNALPHSIESALEDAGFSGTEILILKRLLEQDSLTTRELATKTGKSTGLLEDAMKKLVRKEVVDRQWINGATRYTLISLDAVSHWMADDLRKKHEQMLRKHQNFEAFLSQIKMDKTRPEIHYYEGLDGLTQAYRELLALDAELLSFIPVFCSIEDDPLRDFRVEFFRERRYKGMFQRVIAHNTPLGRRFQTRDPFEYRQTILIDESQYPFTFEKHVCGDYVACFNHTEKRACVMKYPEMASMERSMFEGMWREIAKPKQALPAAAAPEPISAQAHTPVPLSTRTLSGLREFFLSKRSLTVMLALAGIAAVITGGIYYNNRRINIQRLQERALAIVQNSVQEIDPEKVSAISISEDVHKPEYSDTLTLLKEIMTRNEIVSGIYILRSKGIPTEWNFVIYQNRSGEASMPGDAFSDAESIPPSFPSLQKALAFEPFTDKWGTWISAYAPIRNTDGTTDTILGVDIEAAEAGRLTSQSFSIGLSFITLFLILIIIRLAAFNKSLMQEIGHAFNVGKMLRTLPVSIALALLCSGGMYFFTSKLQLQRMRDKLESIAITGALQMNANDLAVLQKEEDWHKPEWDKVVTQLENIRKGNDGIVFAYIFRRSELPGKMEFVADSHSRNPYANTDEDPTNDVDANNDGKIEPEGPDKLQWPGQAYPDPYPVVFAGFEGPASSDEPIEDSYGNVFSGFAPIHDFEGKPIAALAVGMKVEKLQEMVGETMNSVLYFIYFLLIFLIGQLVILNQKFFVHMWKSMGLRQILVLVALSAEISFFITIGFYYYHLRLATQEVGQNLMAIAATAAPQFNPEDIEQLYKAEDMKKDSYQRIFRKLNKIRSNNPGIKWAYIMRKTENEDYWEFVADADSNYFLPSANDLNLDGNVDFADSNVAPGVRYYNNDHLQMHNEPIYTDYPYTDQWGTLISGLAPIFKDNELIGIVGFDSEISEVLRRQNDQFKYVFWFLSIFSIILMLFLLGAKILIRP